MAVNFSCPYCRTPYYNRIITRHGMVTCGKCGKSFRI